MESSNEQFHMKSEYVLSSKHESASHKRTGDHWGLTL